jgi:hypothetical protein
LRKSRNVLSQIPLEYGKADIALQLIVDIALEAVGEVVEVAVQDRFLIVDQ